VRIDALDGEVIERGVGNGPDGLGGESVAAEASSEPVPDLRGAVRVPQTVQPDASEKHAVAPAHDLER